MTPKSGNDFLLVEEFDVGADKRFLNEEVKPYFANIFQDISARSMSPKKEGSSPEAVLDNVAFFEYTNLPGMINDRFYSTFEGSAENQLTKDSFVDGFCRVYLSSIEEKMRLTFRM